MYVTWKSPHFSRAMAKSTFVMLWFLMLAKLAIAQNATSAPASSIIATPPASTTFSGSAIANPTAFTSALAIGLENYWNLFVGPVSTATVNTTVAATPVPTNELIPPPGLYYPSFPNGQQIATFVKNETWKFPTGFWWGVASAAYQVEGAAKAEGRGPSIWDVLLHRVTGYSVANQTGDIANNQYYLYKQGKFQYPKSMRALTLTLILDIARIAALGVKTYSFSISWSRVMPFGNGPINELALAHYDDVIDTCIEYGVEPSVTLYHW